MMPIFIVEYHAPGCLPSQNRMEAECAVDLARHPDLQAAIHQCGVTKVVIYAEVLTTDTNTKFQ